MSQPYRVVLFYPDPMRPFFFPIAAVLNEGDRAVLVPASILPDRTELGSEASVSTLHLVLARIAAAPDLERLPATVGPHARLDAIRQIPDGTANPEAWLSSHVLWRPARLAAARSGRPRPVMPPRRDWAAQFFHAFGMDQHVQRRFQPAEHLDAQLEREILSRCQDRADADVSFYEQGPAELLLMEPLVLGQPSFDEDLNSVAQLFRTYQAARDVWVWSHLSVQPQVLLRIGLGGAPNEDAQDQSVMPSSTSSRPSPFRLLALILPGERETQRRAVHRTLEGTADEILDLIDPSQRRRLAEQIGVSPWPKAAA